MARALEQLPHLREAYSAGLLSWDQVRHATVFVTPDEDQEAVRDLPSFTAAQLEERAKFHRRRRAADARQLARLRCFTSRKDCDGGGYRYRGFLPAEQGAIDGNADTELTFTSAYGRQLRSKPTPLDPNIRRRAQHASGTDLGADPSHLQPTGTDPAPAREPLANISTRWSRDE